jgi:hypothetical protein
MLSFLATRGIIIVVLSIASSFAMGADARVSVNTDGALNTLGAGENSNLVAFWKSESSFLLTPEAVSDSASIILKMKKNENLALGQYHIHHRRDGKNVFMVLYHTPSMRSLPVIIGMQFHEMVTRRF